MAGKKNLTIPEAEAFTDKLKSDYGYWINFEEWDGFSNDPEMSIMNLDKGNRKSFKLPKNLTEEWIIDKLEKMSSSEWKNLRTLFEKIGISGRIYYTSFGFSYDMFFCNREKFNADVDIIEKKLDSMGIEFKCEFSSAKWVYRFRISQSKKNLDIIRVL